MTIFDFDRSSAYLRAYLDSQPKKGHGLLSRWAEALNTSPSLLSQIVRGEKLLSLEVADGLAQFIGLDGRETDYLFVMVELERVGTQRLRQHFQNKLEEAKAASRRLKNRLPESKVLSEEAKARYYSTWLYTGVRNLAVCPGNETAELIAARLRLPRPVIVDAIDFLVRNSLLNATKNGWTTGTNTTYLSSDSPWVIKHHQNWRLKSAQQMDQRNEEDLFYTSPMSLSSEMALQLRKQIVDFTQNVQKKAGPTPSETVRCLTIDWFEY